MITYPPGELKWYVRIFFRRCLHKYFDMFFKEHFVLSAMMKRRLVDAGMDGKKIRIVGLEIRPLDIERIRHRGFNVVYYTPTSKPGVFGRTKNKKYKDWVYGVDIIKKVTSAMQEVNFIKVDGSADMSKVYAIADMVIRPNRSDGSNPPRMILECSSLGIPYYWDSKFKPSAGETIKAIKREIHEKKRNKHVL